MSLYRTYYTTNYPGSVSTTVTVGGFGGPSVSFQRDIKKFVIVRVAGSGVIYVDVKKQSSSYYRTYYTTEYPGAQEEIRADVSVGGSGDVHVAKRQREYGFAQVSVAGSGDLQVAYSYGTRSFAQVQLGGAGDVNVAYYYQHPGFEDMTITENARHGVHYRSRRGVHEIKIVNRQGMVVRSWPEAQFENITWELNQPGAARVHFPLDSLNSRDLRLVNNEVQIWRRGELWWWGVPWRISGVSSQLTVECEGLLSYFNSRYITNTSLEYADLEQFNIAWNLLSYAQQGVSKNLNITAANWMPSGKTRYRLYKRDEHANILNLLLEFPDIRDGFDYDIVYNAAGQRKWTPYFPQKGTFHENTVLEWGGAVIGLVNYGEDAIEMAHEVYVTGGISGDIKFEANYKDPLLSANDVLLQAIISDGTTLDVGWLADRAREEVERRNHPQIIPALRVRDQPEGLIRKLKVGDRVPVYIERGRIQIDGVHRINRLVYYPNETVDVYLSEAA